MDWLTVDDLKGNPAKRSDIDRLNDTQRRAFIELVKTPNSFRSPSQLWDSGIIRPDLSKERFLQLWVDLVAEIDKPYYLSNEFLQKWLDTGYISYKNLPSEQMFSAVAAMCTYYTPEKWPEAVDSREIINMAYAVITDADCHLNFCYLVSAKFDNTDFYKANIVDCVLNGATAYNSYFVDCNGCEDDYSIMTAKYLKQCGVLGIDLNDYARLTL